FFQAEDGIRDATVTGVQTCALPIYLEYFIAVEHAGNVGEEDQPVSMDELSACRSHVVGVDVVELAVSAQAQAGGHRYDARAPERLKELEIHTREIANVTQAPSHFVVHH